MDDGKDNQQAGDMDFNALQEKLGGISRYQIAIIVLVTVLSFGVAIMTQTAVFYSAVPEHRLVSVYLKVLSAMRCIFRDCD